MVDEICNRCIHIQELLAALPNKPQICKECTKDKNKSGYTKHINWEWKDRGQTDA